MLTSDPGQLCPQWLLSPVSPEHLGLLAHLCGALHGHSGTQGKRADLQPGRATLIININFIARKLNIVSVAWNCPNQRIDLCGG